MDEEWRVSLTAGGQLARGEPVSAQAVRDLLCSRVGEGVSVTTGKAGLFLYAATADVAATAAGVAREVLAQQGLAADIRLERWDSAGQAWLPPGEAAAAELPSARERGPGRRRLRAAGALIAAIVDGIGWSLTSGQSRRLRLGGHGEHPGACAPAGLRLSAPELGPSSSGALSTSGAPPALPR